MAGESGFNSANPLRNSNAVYFLPSDDEWHKAGYYNPGSGSYFFYPTGSSTPPTPVTGGTAPGTAIYSPEAGPYTTRSAHVDNAGGLSPYGTMGQGGNAYEWIEGAPGGNNLLSGDGNRGLRGGSYFAVHPSLMEGGFADTSAPSADQTNQGFRVASIPEPSGLSLLGLSVLSFLRRRR
jgi:formylglycine-generating enzyme